ncbi:MAG TPA: hypothetical protein VK864_06930 [Longimicrobiales bacterium]|nr:hypothetical protein [Longimicrobiales bacterium]
MTAARSITALWAATLLCAPAAHAQAADTLAKPNLPILIVSGTAGSLAGGLIGSLATAAVCGDCFEDGGINAVPFFALSAAGAAFGAYTVKQNSVPTLLRSLIGGLLGIPVGILGARLAESIDSEADWVGYSFSQGIVTGLVSWYGKPRQP